MNNQPNFENLSMDDIDLNIDIGSLLFFLNNDSNDIYDSDIYTETSISDSDPDSEYLPDSEDSANFSSSNED